LAKEQLFDELLIFLKVVVEYAFGIHICYFIGWVTGFFVGQFYVEQFEPVYLDDLSQLSYWRLAPYIFARNGGMIGAAAGMIVIAVINHKPHKQGAASLYEVEIDNPNEIARLLGKGVGQIKRKMNRRLKNHIYEAASCK